MPTVREILKRKDRDVARIELPAKVFDAVRVMTDEHVGAVAVTRGGQVVGIFTERDLLNRVVSKQKDPTEVDLEDVMTSPVACCSPDTTRAECRAVMRRERIRHLPVVEGGCLLGMISIRDILEEVTAEQEETIQFLYDYMRGVYR
jgi:CBS domain-containing protein